MQRQIFLALLCLAGIVGLFAMRTIVGLNTLTAVPAKVISADATDLPALTKGDRLPSRFFDSALPKPPVETGWVDVTEPPKLSEEAPLKQSDASKDEIVSWHWHEGSKVVRRRRAQ